VSDHRFKVGQTVSYTPHFGSRVAEGVYPITQLLPPKAATSNTGSKAPMSRTNG
jgi:hypothetical protein